MCITEDVLLRLCLQASLHDLRLGASQSKKAEWNWHDRDLVLLPDQACTTHLILAWVSGRQCARPLLCLHCKGRRLVDGYLREAC